jgi:hypothetical protein
VVALRIIRPPLCGDLANEVPREQWALLLEERQRFCREVMPSDCRMLLFFVEDGARSDWLGFGTRAAYLKDGLGLDPEMVDLALRGLTLTRPDAAVGIDDAIVLGQRGGDRRSVAFKDQSDNVTLKERGNARAYVLARLDRDRPDLAERVRADELSANAAAIEAGWRKQPTPLERIYKLLPKLSQTELDELATEVDRRKGRRR